VLGQVNTLSAPSLAGGMVNALGDSRGPRTGTEIIEHWSQLSPSIRRNALAVLLRRGEWAMALLDAIEKHNLNKGDLAPEHWSNLKQNPNRAVARRAERLAEINATVSADREEIVKKLLPLAKEK